MTSPNVTGFIIGSIVAMAVAGVVEIAQGNPLGIAAVAFSGFAFIVLFGPFDQIGG